MFAVPAISRLINNISSESFHFWLSCLRDVSLAECALMNEKPLPEGMTEKSAASKTTVIENISIALVHYSKAIAAIKVMDVHKKLFVYLNFFCRLLVLCILHCSLLLNICGCDWTRCSACRNWFKLAILCISRLQQLQWTRHKCATMNSCVTAEQQHNLENALQSLGILQIIIWNLHSQHLTRTQKLWQTSECILFFY